MSLNIAYCIAYCIAYWLRCGWPDVPCGAAECYYRKHSPIKAHQLKSNDLLGAGNQDSLNRKWLGGQPRVGKHKIIANHNKIIATHNKIIATHTKS